MKALLISEHGGPEVLRLGNVAKPACHPKSIVIKVEAISVEGGDLLDRSGNLGPLPSTPHIIGRQAAGEITEVGAEVTGFEIGQKVVGACPHGSHAEYFAVPARTSWHVPRGLDMAKASAIPIAYGTAADALSHYCALCPGDTVLIPSATGGVGMAAVQIARQLGASRIIATGSSDERLEGLEVMGATHLINHTGQDVVEEVARITDGQGAQVVLDVVGGKRLQEAIDCIALKGRIVMAGQAAREAACVDVTRLFEQSASLHGFRLDIGGPRIRKAIETLLDDCASERLAVLIDRVFPLARGAEAHRYIEGRSALGRVVLRP